MVMADVGGATVVETPKEIKFLRRRTEAKRVDASPRLLGELNDNRDFPLPKVYEFPQLSFPSIGEIQITPTECNVTYIKPEQADCSLNVFGANRVSIRSTPGSL